MEFDPSELCDKNGRPLQGIALTKRLERLKAGRQIEFLFSQPRMGGNNQVPDSLLSDEDAKLLTLATVDEIDAIKKRLLKLETRRLVAQTQKQIRLVRQIALTSFLVGAIAGFILLIIRPSSCPTATVLGGIAGAAGRALLDWDDENLPLQ